MNNKTDDNTPWDDMCGHDFKVLCYNASIDFTPESPYYGIRGPWMRLRCRVCGEETVRPYHPGYRVKQEIIQYLLGDATQYTATERTWMDRFIQADPAFVRAIIRHELDSAQERHHRHRARAQWNRAYARRLRAWLATT